MKVLYLSTYYFPEKYASQQLALDRTEAFANNGLEILIYTPIPCRGIDDDVRRTYRSKKDEILYGGKVRIHRFPLVKEGKNPILRASRYTLQCLKQFCLGAFSKEARKCDVIYLGSTPPIFGAMAALIKKFNKKPIVYNLQDIFPDTLVGAGLAKKDGLLWKIGRVIENYTYRNADRIIVISEDCKRNIMAKGVSEQKIEVIYNWVDENAVVPVSKEDNPSFEEFGIDREKFTVVYAGNLGNTQNIGIIIEAAKRLKSHSDIQFVIFGTGGLEETIRKQIRQDALFNVKLLPLQPFERVSYVYGLGDACIVSCKQGLGGAAMPSKTWSIMSSGRAVLANFDEGELKRIIEDNDCGIFTKAGDLDGFAEAVVSLAQSPAKCKEMGEASRQFVLDNLTKAIGTGKTVDIVKSVYRRNS